MTPVGQTLAVDRDLHQPVALRAAELATRVVPPARSSTHHLPLGARTGRAATGSDAGFTFIELMAVLAILAILLAVAIPSFFRVTRSASDRAAQSNLNTAMLHAKAVYQSNGQSFSTPIAVVASVLPPSEPGVTFTTGNSTGQGVVSVFPTADGSAIVLAAFTRSNNCWYQIDNPSGNAAAVQPFTRTGANVSGGATAMTGGAVTTVAAGGLRFSGTTPGTTYVEVKGDRLATDCNARNPTIPANTSYQWLRTAFPAN